MKVKYKEENFMFGEATMKCSYTFESYHIMNATIQYICWDIIAWNYMSVTVVYREDPNKVLAVEEDTK